MRQRKWSTSPTMPGMHALSVGAPLPSKWVASQVLVLMRLCGNMRACFRLFVLSFTNSSPTCARWRRTGYCLAQRSRPCGRRSSRSVRRPELRERFIGLVGDEHLKGHFPEVWDPRRSQKACLLSPDTGSTVSPATSPALPLPDVQTINRFQQALKMLGCRIALDGDYGAETRQVVAGFQMRTGIVADGVGDAQTEAKLLSELSVCARREVDPDFGTWG